MGGVVVDKLARGKNHSDQMEPQIVTKGGYGCSGAGGRENSALLLTLGEQRGGDLLKKNNDEKYTHTHTPTRDAVAPLLRLCNFGATLSGVRSLTSAREPYSEATAKSTGARILIP